MNIYFFKSAKKDFDALNEPIRSRIDKAIAKLPLGDVKKLQGTTHRYRLRVGDMRVLFEYDPEHQAITIVKIAPRGQAYKGGV